MKKMLLTLFAMYASMNIANAQATGGFEGPSASQLAATTVQEALDLNDEAKVVLQGNIVNSLGDEKYTFKDATGEIVVEIDDEDWHGVKVTPGKTVEIIGEVDKDANEPTKIDVDAVTVK
ncbi:MAG: NirD/YgiW/YdeI family stress tolerance protein [Alphaproteobacteria bacterium]|nr:NirD/YgiW/YdeI family stress tolerance protein [Alphaproteobacteria bacterium]